jgi:MFS family permease
VTAQSAPESEEDPEGIRSLLAGLVAVARSPMLRAPYALFGGLLLLEGTSDVQLVALSLGKLGLGNGGPGLLYTAWGAGGMLGAAVLLIVVHRRGYGLALFVGGLVFAGGLAAVGTDGVAVALIAMIPAGVGFALVETAVVGLVPRLADDTIIGRVYGLSEILYAGAAGLGALVAPLLIDAFGAAGSLAVVGGAFAAGTLVAGRSLARLDVGQEEAGRVRELLRKISFLDPLPLPLLERLVRGARSAEFQIGTEIVRRGEPGEEYFVIEHGTVEVLEFGRRQGPGEGFGEIALLRDVPRTATVRAVSEVRAWVVTRSAFVAAVAGHREARELADALVAERLAGARRATTAPPDAR